MSLGSVSIIFMLFNFVNCSVPVIYTNYGPIVGIEQKSFNNRTIFAYMGIPYGNNPDRFEEATEPEKWQTVLRATSLKPKCYQLSIKRILMGSEDCLYLNVYKPETENRNLLSVIVLLAGGSFSYLSGSAYGGRYLLDREVIFVTFNYRLGILGFLCTEDSVSPGNNGLKDQVLVFKWIKENIVAFGGNPNSITLLGMSAGASSIHMHYFSPLSSDLFHKAILIGGSGIAEWSFQKNSLSNAQRIGTALRCQYNTTKELVQCLKNQTASDLLKAMPLFNKFFISPIVIWAPVLDVHSSKPFLIEYPYISLIKGNFKNKPIIYSLTTNEGTMPGLMYVDEMMLDYLDKNWNLIAPHLLHYHNVVPANLMNPTSEAIRKKYIKNSTVTPNTINLLINIISDRFFVESSVKAAKLQSKMTKSSVYFYLFNYRGPASTSITFSNTEKNYGLSHIDDLAYYVNYSKGGLVETNAHSVEMIKLFTGMAERFADTGIPDFGNGIEWFPLTRNTKDDLKILRIDSPYDMFMANVVNLGNGIFWNSLPMNEPWSGRFYDASNTSVININLH